MINTYDYNKLKVDKQCRYDCIHSYTCDKLGFCDCSLKNGCRCKNCDDFAIGFSFPPAYLEDSKAWRFR